MLTEGDIENYIRAGRIACRVRKEVENYIIKGMKILDLAEYIERRIVELGGELAFPVNISLNNIAAHYTPLPNDTKVISEDSIVKIDIGVHIDGCIADTAITITLSEIHRPLAEATKQALEKVLTVISPNKRFSEVGAIIEKVIRDCGFKPVYNLSGHRIDRFLIHAGETIPNFNDRLNIGRFRSGCVYAIEPFATNGVGLVVDADDVTIYSIRYNPKRIRRLSREATEIYSYIYSSRKSLPFAKRWLIKKFDEYVVDKALHELSLNNLLTNYHVLIEKSGGLVSQFEHTILIDNSGNVIVLTDQC